MPACQFLLSRIGVLAMLAVAAHCTHAEPASTNSAPQTALVIQGLGKGTVILGGPWQFHVGDNPAWASPSFDTSHWEQLSADRPWGQQGHANLTGFAWYRCYLALTPAPGLPPQFSLLVPKVGDPYEIYWNGALIGRNGKLPPNSVWYISQPMQAFNLGPVQQGVLAVRVWKSPLLSDDSGERGGFDTAPLIGSPQAIATANAAFEYRWLRSRQLHFAANLLCAVLAFLSFILWLRTPNRRVLLWTAGFAIAQPAILLLEDAHMGWSYPLAEGAAQPLCALQDVSLWFLLLWLLPLHGNRTLLRLTRILASIYAVSTTLDGVLIALFTDPAWAHFVRVSDAALTLSYIFLQALPLFLVGYALFQCKQFDSGRWLIAILAFLDEMMTAFRNVIQQGRQFTAWPLAERVHEPLFFIDGNGITLNTLSGTLLFIAIVYAVYNSVREDQRRQDVLEDQKKELLHESHRMRYQAEHDGLTGLWNHRVIVERLSLEMNRAQRQASPLSVILIDVDHFKKVNDSFGHLAGDLVLQGISTIFTRSLRPYDSVGRYGGEEFLLILPNCGIEGALLRAEQIRAAVQSARFKDGDTTLQVTASFGVASVAPSHYEPDSVMRAIDAALYRAKSSGRNCVIQAEMEASVRER